MTWVRLRAQVSSCLSFLSDDLTVFAMTLCKKANRFLGLTFCKWYTDDWVKGTCLQSLLLDSRFCRIFFFFRTSIPRKEKERSLVVEMKLCLNYTTWLITGKLWLLFLSLLPYNWALMYKAINFKLREKSTRTESNLMTFIKHTEPSIFLVATC